ncbi:MAG: S8 family serine peptidase [Xanthomonadaceae bacterium]|nr:S8 family serine peptidase [Xanthomonadaceae bacterium]
MAKLHAHAAESVPGEVIVQFKPQARASLNLNHYISKMNRDVSLKIAPRLSVKREPADIEIFTVSDATQTSKVIEALKSQREIKYAEPNYIYHTTRDPGLPTDVDLGLQWSIRNTGQKDSAGQQGIPDNDIGVLKVWRQGWTGNRRVVVAIIDTGVDYNHPDLAANIYRNPLEIPGNGIDDDSNGYIDDVRGWDFQNNDNDPMDDNNHGTHCAGVIGAQGNNSLGIAGINHQVSILPIKFLGTNGGTLEGAIKSIQYATLMKVNIMSNSWGGGGESKIMQEAIEKARDQGILFVAAAGNASANNDSESFYPANYSVSNVLSVAAIDNRDELASFSNYGKTKVHVGAPGVKIYSSVIDGKYQSYSGTSMACPHVAGIAALMRSRKVYENAEEIKDRIMRTVVRIPSLRKKVASNGRVNAFNAVFNQIPPNDEPDDSAWVKMDSDIESIHPYAAGIAQSWTITAPVPAKFIRAYFSKIDTETNYDFLTLSDASGVEFLKYSGAITDFTTDYVAGSTIQVKLTSDQTQERWGFKLDRIEYVPASL